MQQKKTQKSVTKEMIKPVEVARQEVSKEPIRRKQQKGDFLDDIVGVNKRIK